MEKLWVVCEWLYAENGALLLVGIWWLENKNKLVEWKAIIVTMGIAESADLEFWEWEG